MAALRMHDQYSQRRLEVEPRRRRRRRSRGCGGVPYASSDPAFPGSFEQRHPIVVAAAPTSVDLYPGRRQRSTSVRGRMSAPLQSAIAATAQARS